jgi:formylglycine-generating enzyme required for sulfatase activity
MPSIFISYRRGPSGYAAHSIHEKLTNSVDSAFVVLDVDAIPLGADFREFLDNEVSKCDVLLAVIGDEWQEELRERLNDPRDFVRIEIGSALKRKIPVIPVLVGKASMPAPMDLPEDLVELAYRHATELRSGSDYQAHLNRLVRGVSSLLPEKPMAATSEGKTTRERTPSAKGTGLRSASRRQSEVTAPHVSASRQRPAIRTADGRRLRLAPSETFRDRLKDGGEGPLMIVIPPGRFLMGSPQDDPERSNAEGPRHKVHIAKVFAMGVYAVTFDEYDLFCERKNLNEPDDSGWGRGKRPAINVSWNDAEAYCLWLSEQTARPYRLPSEAEWEYACRAGTATLFHGGDHLSYNEANFNATKSFYLSEPAPEQTTPVGSFRPNAFGLYDMHGNVWEWCQDTWHDTYDGAPKDGSAWTDGSESSSHVLRGGSWSNGSRHCRSAYRNEYVPISRRGGVGFRVCCSYLIE